MRFLRRHLLVVALLLVTWQTANMAAATIVSCAMLHDCCPTAQMDMQCAMCVRTGADAAKTAGPCIGCASNHSTFAWVLGPIGVLPAPVAILARPAVMQILDSSTVRFDDLAPLSISPPPRG
jgi:hypothetical protein